MPKRFTATEKWDDPWFCSLTPIQKLLWVYLCDKCDHAGVWRVNWPLVKFHIGVDEVDPGIFDGRIAVLSKDKWFLTKFVDFQYGSELNPNNRTHKSVLSILEKEGATKGLARSTEGRKDKGKVRLIQRQDKDKPFTSKPTKEFLALKDSL